MAFILLNTKKFNKDLPYWFSTIDASSLCIWNPNVIKKFKYIDLTKFIHHKY